jgi:hypothetical protein
MELGRRDEASTLTKRNVAKKEEVDASHDVTSPSSCTKSTPRFQQRKEEKGSKFSLYVKVFILVSMAVIVLAYKVKYGGLRLTLNPRALLRQLTSRGTTLDPDLFLPPDSNKYASDVVRYNTRKLLAEETTRSCPPFKVEGDLEHVDAALGKSDLLRQDDMVFLMLNGLDDGVFVKWRKTDGCLHELAQVAATALGSDPDFFPNGLRFLSTMGVPITTADELDAERVVHILVDFQIWVWPGVKVGYERIVDGCRMVRHVSVITNLYVSSVHRRQLCRCHRLCLTCKIFLRLTKPMQLLTLA